jgi:thymidylate synthase (FAD)
VTIRIITEPQVYLVAKTMPTSELFCFLADVDPDHKFNANSVSGPQGVVEVAGRVCYNSFANARPGGNEAYIHHLLESGHGSCLEFANYVFVFSGISRSCSMELIRHRHFSFAQRSQRYCDESDCAFVMPPGILAASDLCQRKWEYDCERLQQHYTDLVEALHFQYAYIENPTERRKTARQAARSVLPNCTETQIFVSANARAWRHFLELRGSKHADAEIRRLALAVLGILQQESPAIFGDYEVKDGEIVTKYRKV